MIIALIAQMALFYEAIVTEGADPRWLIYYSDLNGDLCAPSFSDEFESMFNLSTGGNFAAWPDIRMYDIRICVESCDDTLTDQRIVTPPLNADIDEVEIEIDVDGISVDISGYATLNVLDALCIPDPEFAADIISDMLDADYSDFEDHFDTLSDLFSLAVADIETAWLLFVVCAVSALIVSMFWGWLIRKIGEIIIWVSIICTLLGVALVAYCLVTYSEYAYLFGYGTIGDIMYYAGYTLAVLDGMFALAVCSLWSRIRLAIKLAQETTRALHDVWTLFFYPLVPFIAFVAFMSYWTVSGLFIASVLEETENPMPAGYTIPYYTDGPTLQSKLALPEEDATFVSLSTSQLWQYLCLYHFFVLLWVTHFVSYHTLMVIAGVYAEWYFADWTDATETAKQRGSDSEELAIDGAVVRNEKDLQKIEMMHRSSEVALDGNVKHSEELVRITKLSRCPVIASFCRVTVYHSGTIAFASLLVAIIEFVRYTLEYFEKKFLNSDPSPLQKAVLCAVKCCLGCLQCIVDKINRNGLVITSIYGWPLCAASMKGLALIFTNGGRKAALVMVSGYLAGLGKLCILSLNMAISMLFAKYYYGDGQLSSLIFPALICFLISFVVCWQYMHLYEVGISTLFMCFLIDEQRNKSMSEMKASKRLRKIIGAQRSKADERRDATERLRSLKQTDGGDSGDAGEVEMRDVEPHEVEVGLEEETVK